MIKKIFLATLALGVLSTSCSNDDDDNNSSTPTPTNSDLTLTLDGLEPLGDDYVYEGWIIVDDQPVSTGVFSSIESPQTFSVNAEQLKKATTFVLSIEPANDPDPLPADTKILAGDFSNNSAELSSNGIVADFASSTGEYILATPTDEDDTNEASGVWFLNNSDSSGPVAGLSLPQLTAGWKYEGWVVFDGTPISTGTFTSAEMADDNAATSIFKGTAKNGPPFPGEDFLLNAPDGLTFPTDLKGKTIVISVEPSPDNSPAPFALKPLAHVVPADAMTHTVIAMGSGPLKVLEGTVQR